MSDRLSIGEIATATRRSVHALRWYEREGLLPGVSRDGRNRRVYRAAHIGWLRFLDRLKRTGMSIAEMKRYAALTAEGAATAADRKAMLVRHRERLDVELAVLAEAHSILDCKIAFYDQWQRTGRRPHEPDIPPAPVGAVSGIDGEGGGGFNESYSLSDRSKSGPAR